MHSASMSAPLCDIPSMCDPYVTILPPNLSKSAQCIPRLRLTDWIHCFTMMFRLARTSLRCCRPSGASKQL